MSDKTILLVGDSILDNAYWPDASAKNEAVGKDCTGDKLQALCGKRIKVYNHAVEETRASDWYSYIKSRKSKTGTEYAVNHNAGKAPEPWYYEAAKHRGVKTAYHSVNINEKVPFFPKLPRNTNIRIKASPYCNLTVFISCIGNDLFLNGEWMRFIFNASSLVKRLEGIIKAYKVHYPGCKVVYIFPYRPDTLLGMKTTGLVGSFLNYKINAMRSKLQEFIFLDDIIDLTKEFVFPEDYNDPGTGIPEPTKKGAGKLAHLIYDYVTKH